MAMGGDFTFDDVSYEIEEDESQLASVDDNEQRASNAATSDDFPKIERWNGKEAATLPDLLTRSKQITVTDADTYKEAAGILVKLKRIKRAMLAHYQSITRKFDEKKREVFELRDDQQSPVADAIERLDRDTVDWQTEEKKKEDAKRRELEAAAKKKAEAEKLQKALAAKEQAKAESDPGLRRALKAEAAAIMATPATPEKVSMPSFVPKVTGFSTTTRYGAQCDDLMQLVKAVAEGREPIEYLMPNMVMANKRAENQKDAFNLPGFTLTKQTGSTGR